MSADNEAEARRWLNTAERAELDAALIPALLGIGYALLAVRDQVDDWRRMQP